MLWLVWGLELMTVVLRHKNRLKELHLLGVKKKRLREMLLLSPTPSGQLQKSRAGLLVVVHCKTVRGKRHSKEE